MSRPSPTADIQALYRRELLERFSAYAFPRREGGFNRGGSWRKRGSRRPDNANRLRHAAAGGARQSLAAAIVAGLVRYPGEVARHAGVLVHATALDPRFELLIDACDAGEPLESAQLATILSGKGFEVPGSGDYARMPYPFLRDDAEAPVAREALAAAIAKLVEEPAIDAAIEEATERFDIVEQDRLRARKDELNRRLRELAGRQSA